MIVVAGPPGSGKSRYFPVTAFGIDSFNIDDRCAQILGTYRAIPRDVRRAVAKECERFVLDHINRGASFAVETTLRTAAAIEQAELARKNGFATEMRFVATDSIAENVARVIQRAQAGGHGASEREIRAIHQASVANLRKAIVAFERVRVYDSTARWAPPRLIALARGIPLVLLDVTPAWLEAALMANED
jgi:predicted ABC-type ATPase